MGLWWVRLWYMGVWWTCVGFGVTCCGVWGCCMGGGGGVLWGCIAALWWVVVHCGGTKSVHEGLGGITNFWDDFLISGKLILSVNF